MWLIAQYAPVLPIPGTIGMLAAGTLAVTGIAIALTGVIAFRRVSTTVHPNRPEQTSALVSSGLYGISRNPMYVGLLLVLVAWSVFLSSIWSLAGPIAFVLYISRFQIVPEERVLSAKFGEAYDSYKARVRRWL